MTGFRLIVAFLFRFTISIASFFDKATSKRLRITRTFNSFTKTILATQESSLSIYRFDCHVVMANDKIGSQLLPTSKHLLCFIDTIVIEELLHLCRFHRLYLRLYFCLLVEIRLLQRVSHLFQVGEES